MVRPLLAALLASSILLAACGDDEGSALSRGEYVKQANAVCRDYNEKLAAVPEPKSDAGIRGYIDQAKKLTDEAVTELDGLEPPEALAKDHDAYVTSGREVSKLAGALADAAEKKDQAELQRLSQQGDKTDAASDETAKRLGLTECAKD